MHSRKKIFHNMIDTFKVLEITCPTCGKMRNINIPESIFLQKKFGTVKIQVPMNAVCPEHQFIVFVDTKGVVRGYEKIDIQMAIEEGEEIEGRLNLRKLIQIFGFYGVFSLIHAKIFNYPTYIIKDEKFEYSEEILNSIGDMILPESLKGSKSIYLFDDPEIDDTKMKDVDALVMDTNQHIFQTPWKKKMKFEEEIIKRALDIIDEEEQIRLLQQDINHFVNETDLATYILQDVDEIYEDKLIKKLSKSLKIKKVSNYHFNLIKEYIARNISANLVTKIKNKVGEFLSFSTK
ncbi:MAG: hypothetical protein ACFFCI_16740 [Promethearchaeota archaeon]